MKIIPNLGKNLGTAQNHNLDQNPSKETGEWEDEY